MPSLGRLRYLDVPAGGPERLTGRPSGTLILLHGFPLSADMWQPQLQLADKGWRIIAPYLGGMGGGAAPANPDTTTIDDYAAEVIDLIDGLHLDQAVIAGLSMGGYAALALFRHAPRYFRGLVLADTRPQADSADAVLGRERMLGLLRERGLTAVVDEMVPKLLGETTRRERPEVVETVRRLAMANAPDAVAGALHALMTREDSTPLLASIHCPALVVVGEEDAITPRPLSEAMQSAIAGAELVVIPRAGHLTNLEQPDAFNAAVGRFLEHRV